MTDDGVRARLRDALSTSWAAKARPSQRLPAGDWSIWLLLAGRGFGKTRVLSETANRWASSGEYSRIAIVAATAADARDVIAEGESGILSTAPSWCVPLYQPTRRRIVWPNGGIATLFSAEEPDRLRGPQHDAALCFAAGTMVLTPSGERAIETMAVGELVVTRSGPRRVVKTHAKRSQVGSISFDNNRSLLVTAEHPVLQFGCSWKAASELRAGEKVCAARVSSGEGGDGIGMLAVTMSTAAHEVWGGPIGSAFIERFGHRSTVCRYLGLTYTTLTGIVGTTIRETCSCYGTASINAVILLLSRSLALIGARSLGLNIPVTAAGGRSFVGNDRTRGGLSAVAVSGFVSRSSRRPLGFADTAESHFNPCPAITAASVVSIWEPAGEAKVFNITVEGQPEYFANGILVHNCDELASWRNPEAFDMLNFGLRLGKQPRTIIATTPRPTKLIRSLVSREGKDVVITRGSSYENRDNLAPQFFSQIVSRYEGTRLGRQELNAELLEDTPGALWTLDMLDRSRRGEAPDLARIVVAVDPSVSSHEGSDETGIIVAGKDSHGRGWVLEDLSGRYTPEQWARMAINAYRAHGADRIVAEVNQGGDLVENTLRTIDASISFTSVHASRGKYIRAEPCAALFEQNKVHLVGSFPELEDQLTGFVVDMDRARNGSPDRADALVYAITELMVEAERYSGLLQWYEREAAKVEALDSENVTVLPEDRHNGKPEAWVVYTTPHRCFQAASGRKYEADEGGEIEVGDAEDMVDLLRVGCRAER